MTLRVWGLVFCVGALLAVVMKPAYARWMEMHVTPLSASSDGRTVRVRITRTGQKKECSVTVLRDAKGARPFQKWSYGSLVLAQGEPSGKGGVVAVPMTEKRERNQITFTFRAPAEQLPYLRFEFWDGVASDPMTLAGGTRFWLLLGDFAPVSGVVPVSKPI